MSTYQLTQYPVGTKREFWTLTWPLMVGLFSSMLMLFVDRLFLARFNLLALNASASGGMAYWIFLCLPMGIATVSEVLVGRLHGEGHFKDIGSAAWQMVWFSCLLIPVFWLIGWVAPPLLFRGSGNTLLETEYFRGLMLFGGAQCTTIAFSGFFIGIGRVKIVTLAAIIGNIVNIALDYVFIYGWGPIPSWGVSGAAWATGLSQVAQTLFLLAIFFKREFREAYQTCAAHLRRTFLVEGLRIGAPVGLGRVIEVIGHFVFIRFVMYVSATQMTLVTIVQSFCILVSFVIEAQSKGAATIVSNLLGANVREPLKRVLRAGFILHGCYFIGLLAVLYFMPNYLLSLFSSPEERAVLCADPQLMPIFTRALMAMALFFLLDGFVWILAGFLTASGDTRFIFWLSVFVNWVAYVIPSAFFIGYLKGGADVAWAVVAGMNLVNLLFYFWRYKSGKWLKAYRPL